MSARNDLQASPIDQVAARQPVLRGLLHEAVRGVED